MGMAPSLSQPGAGGKPPAGIRFNTGRGVVRWRDIHQQRGAETMVWLAVGVLVWSLVHLFPSLAPEARAGLVARVGEGPFKGLFALVIVGSIVLMVVGWRAVVPAPLYTMPSLARGVAIALMIIALVLFFAPWLPTNIRRAVRHPQLTAILVWGAAHLLASGDNRSMVLFGGLGLWSVVAMALITRREGDWERPEAKPPTGDAVAVVLGIVAYLVLLFVHPWLFGGPALAGGWLAPAPTAP
jgi:uncharacterized membrane protein